MEINKSNQMPFKGLYELVSLAVAQSEFVGSLPLSLASLASLATSRVSTLDHIFPQEWIAFQYRVQPDHTCEAAACCTDLSCFETFSKAMDAVEKTFSLAQVAPDDTDDAV